ncbi:MAG: hypothetical protein JSS67_12330 [Bacteroidetes bacterium]|nr:hypothetical protein [Bacteroidota bacterium]
MSSHSLDDFKINIKIKLSTLWASVTFLYIYGDYFELYVPHKVQELISGDGVLDKPIKLFAASLLLAIPSLMICLSVLLKSSINRLLNIITGILFTVIMLLIAITSFSEWRLFYVFYAILESILTSIIIWKAWNWTKNEHNI